MSLRTLTLLVMIGIAVNFVIRLAGTLPGVWLITRPAVISASVLHLLAALAVVFFFTGCQHAECFSDRPRVRQAAAIAAWGAIIGLLLPLKSFLFHSCLIRTLPNAVTLGVELLGPLVATITMIVFLIALYQDQELRQDKRLSRGIHYGLAGTGLFFWLHLIVIFNYVIHFRLHWLSRFPVWLAPVTLPLVTAASAALFYFFYTFRQHLALPSES